MTKFIAHADDTTYTFTTINSLDPEVEYTALKRITTLHPEVKYIEVHNGFGFTYTHYTEKATKYELICKDEVRIYYNYAEALEVKRNLLMFFDKKDVQLIKSN